jgi:hypothetical protein
MNLNDIHEITSHFGQYELNECKIIGLPEYKLNMEFWESYFEMRLYLLNSIANWTTDGESPRRITALDYWTIHWSSKLYRAKHSMCRLQPH